MQQVATEIRLLGVLLRQHEANAKNEPAPVPFLVTPAPRRRRQARRCPVAADAGAVPMSRYPMREMEAAVEKMPAPGETGRGADRSAGARQLRPSRRRRRRPNGSRPGGAARSAIARRVYVSRAALAIRADAAALGDAVLPLPPVLSPLRGICAVQDFQGHARRSGAQIPAPAAPLLSARKPRHSTIRP